MNPFQKKVIDTINPLNRQHAGPRRAIIRAIDPETKLCSIMFNDEQYENGAAISNVPILIQQGVHNAGPFVGDTVVVGFFNNDFRQPYVMGSIDLSYKYATSQERVEHVGKGAEISDLYCRRDGEVWKK